MENTKEIDVLELGQIIPKEKPKLEILEEVRVVKRTELYNSILLIDFMC